MSADQNTKKVVMHFYGRGCSNIPNINIKNLFIKQMTEDSWLVRGAGEGCYLNYSQVSRSIISDLKVQCEDISCPTCKRKEKLNYEIKELNIRNHNSFAFKAEIICEKCSKRRSLKKIIDNVANIKKLKISLTGIEIER
ncbi:MAG TPA: hypothetical protein HA262_01090 [Methanosarcina sp.]|jgi:hypothetical protein|nr:hypothetical protein [Methanosarcina sp.]